MESVRQLEGRWLARGILVAVLAGFSAVTGAQTAGQVAPPPADLEPGVNTSATQPERSATETQWRESHEAPTVRRGGGNPEKRQGRDAGQPSSPEPAAAQPKPAQTTTKPATAAGRAAAASGTRQSAGATSASQDAPAGDSLANRSVAAWRGAFRGQIVEDAAQGHVQRHPKDLGSGHEVFRINQLRLTGLSQPAAPHVRYTRHVWVCYARAAL
jgi:hypothetical protein